MITKKSKVALDKKMTKLVDDFNNSIEQLNSALTALLKNEESYRSEMGERLEATNGVTKKVFLEELKEYSNVSMPLMEGLNQLIKLGEHSIQNKKTLGTAIQYLKQFFDHIQTCSGKKEEIEA
jgi:hypothetical protein